jgi:signal peptidase
MSTAVRAGDVLVSHPYAGEELTPGRIVVFRQEEDGRQVTHRIVKRNPDGTYVTQGDANPAADSTPLAEDDIRASASYVVPWIGRPVVWNQHGEWLPLGLAVLTLAAPWQMPGYATRREDDPWLPSEPITPEPRTRRSLLHRLPRRSARHAGRRVIVSAVAVMALTAGSVTSTADTPSSTANAGNSLVAPTTFAGVTCTEPEVKEVTGWESGPAGTATGPYDGLNGDATIDAVAARTGDYGVKVVKSGSSQNAYMSCTTTGTVMVARLMVRLPSCRRRA